MLDFFEDIAAEQAVIGGLLLDQSKALDICEMLKPDDFSRPSHKLIFQVIYDLNEQQIKSDVVTVQSSLNERGQLSQIGGLHYLAELAQNTPSAANIKHYATTVADLSKLAQIGSELREAQNALLGDEDAKDRINNAYSIISDIGQDETEKGERSFNEIQTELARELERRSQLGGGLTGVSTGFEDLDKRFNGLQKTDLIILAARPAMGKTTLAINIAQEVAKHKHVAIFSMEMSAEQITEKVWASLGGGFKLKDIKQGNLDTDYSSYLLANISEAKKLRIDIDDRGAL
ncbi:MAG: replicative DNA helicase, partial [Candidatus Brocadiaceae bacterium]|nr:replicative DNA helicase [Candidatus Brocadiaceae bacterium]